MLLIDVSGSNEFGTKSAMKEAIITEIAAVLAFSAIQNNDKVGVIFFSDKIEKFIPPKKGTSHILRIIRELIDFKSESQGTKISESLRYLTNAIKKRCTAFVLSDFIDTGFEEALQIAGNKHDVTAIRIFDPRETELPNMGITKFRDAETGKNIWVDTTRKTVRETYKKWHRDNDIKLKRIFIKCGTDAAYIRTDHDYVRQLIGLFKRREART
jgi:uncharacterized protein (DUF58 family)